MRGELARQVHLADELHAGERGGEDDRTGQEGVGSVSARRGSNIDTTSQATTYKQPATRNDAPATATPLSRRRLTTVATRAMPAISPAIAPITFGDALARTGSCHAKQLAATSALVSDRPAHIMPKRPSRVATHRVELGCDSAVSIWLANAPVMLALSRSSRSIAWAKKPSKPVKKRSIGTKKRKSRNAIALPTSVPADSRSR